MINIDQPQVFIGFGWTCLKQVVLARHVQLTQEVEEDAAGDTLTELGDSRIQHGVLNLVQSHILGFAIQEPPKKQLIVVPIDSTCEVDWPRKISSKSRINPSIQTIRQALAKGFLVDFGEVQGTHQQFWRGRLATHHRLCGQIDVRRWSNFLQSQGKAKNRSYIAGPRSFVNIRVPLIFEINLMTFGPVKNIYLLKSKNLSSSGILYIHLDGNWMTIPMCKIHHVTWPFRWCKRSWVNSHRGSSILFSHLSLWMRCKVQIRFNAPNSNMPVKEGHMSRPISCSDHSSHEIASEDPREGFGVRIYTLSMWADVSHFLPNITEALIPYSWIYYYIIQFNPTET